MLVIWVITGSTTDLSKARWEEFAPEGGGFRVELPGTARRENSAPDGAATYIYQVDRENGFTISCGVLPPDDHGRVPAERRFQAARDGMLASLPGARVVAERPVTLQGLYPGRELEIEESAAKAGKVLARIYIANGRLYVLIAGGTRLDPRSDEVQRFFNSFKVIKSGRPAAPPPAPDPAQPPASSDPGPPTPYSHPAPPAKPSALAGLLGYWPFDEGQGDRADDASGKGNRGTLHRARWVTGVRGKAVGFDGKESWLSYGESPAFDFPAGAPFTFAVWVQTADLNGAIVSQRNPQDGGPVIDLLVQQGQLLVHVRQDGREFGSHATFLGVPIADRTWHHVALTREADGTVALFVDGIARGSSQAPDAKGAITTHWRALGREVYWSSKGGGSLDQQYLRGWLDEFCIYDRALSLEEIRALAGVGP